MTDIQTPSTNSNQTLVREPALTPVPESLPAKVPVGLVEPKNNLRSTILLVLALVVFVGVLVAGVWLYLNKSKQDNTIEISANVTENGGSPLTDTSRNEQDEIASDIEPAVEPGSRFETEAEFEQYLDLKQTLLSDCDTNRVGDISVAVDILSPGKASFLYWFMFEKLGTSPTGVSPYEFVYRDASGSELKRVAVGGQYAPEVGVDDELKVAIPYVANTSKIELYYQNGAEPIGEKIFSSCMPQVAWIDDPAGKTFTGKIDVSWVGVDPDEGGEELEYLINLRRGDWELVEVLGVTHDEEYSWPITEDIAPGTYRLGLFASDGVNTGALFSEDFVIQ